MRKTIVDAGPLIAIFKKSDPDKAWATEMLRRLAAPIYTVEPVITEVAYFLQASGQPWIAFLDRLNKGKIVVPTSLADLSAAAIRLAESFPDADLADAAIVALYEKQADAIVVTLDTRDFSKYRTSKRKVIKFTSPETSRDFLR